MIMKVLPMSTVASVVFPHSQSLVDFSLGVVHDKNKGSKDEPTRGSNTLLIPINNNNNNNNKNNDGNTIQSGH
jgi:hypothetical protein